MHVLVIGFPTAAASITAEKLLADGAYVSLLVPPASFVWAKKRFGGAHSRLCLLEGMSHGLDFGLSGTDYLKLVDRVDRLILAPDVGENTPLSILIDTATEIEAFVVQCSKPVPVVYLSSISVAGSFNGVFAEQDFVVSQGVLDPADEAHYTLESLVRRLNALCPLTIVRSGMLVGDYPGITSLSLLSLAGREPFVSKGPYYPVCTAIDSLGAFLSGLCTLCVPPHLRVFHYFRYEEMTFDAFRTQVWALAKEQLNRYYDLAKGANALLDDPPQPQLRIAPPVICQAQLKNEWSSRIIAEQGLPFPEGLGDTVNQMASWAAEAIGGFR